MLPLRVLCNANADVGYGHFFRCLFLVNEWQRLTSQSVNWYGDIDEHLHTHCARVIKQDWESVISQVKCAPPSIVLCDSYLLNEQHVNELAVYHKVIVINDFGDYAFGNAFAVINFTVAAKSYAYASEYRLLGPKYFLCHPSLDAVREQNIARNTSFELTTANILIAMGGYDRHQIGGQLAEHLGKAFPAASITLLGKYDDALVYSLPKNVESIARTDRMDALFQRANLVISGGGLIKYESAYCGVVNVVLAQTMDQMQESQQFKALNLCDVYGMARNLLGKFESTKEAENEREISITGQKNQDNAGVSFDDFVTWLTGIDLGNQQVMLRQASAAIFSTESSYRTAKRLLHILGEKF